MVNLKKYFQMLISLMEKLSTCGQGLIDFRIIQTFIKHEDKLEHWAESNGPKADEAAPEVIQQRSRIFQAEDEDVPRKRHIETSFLACVCFFVFIQPKSHESLANAIKI